MAGARLDARLGNLVVCENSADRLCGPLFVGVEHTTQPFVTHNGGIHVDHAEPLLNQPIVESLMVSFEVIMLCVFLHSVAKMLLSQWDDLG